MIYRQFYKKKKAVSAQENWYRPIGYQLSICPKKIYIGWSLLWY